MRGETRWSELGKPTGPQWRRFLSPLIRLASRATFSHKGRRDVSTSPADAVSTPGQSANTRSAVGQRRRLREQRKRRLVSESFALDLVKICESGNHAESLFRSDE